MTVNLLLGVTTQAINAAWFVTSIVGGVALIIAIVGLFASARITHNLSRVMLDVFEARVSQRSEPVSPIQESLPAAELEARPPAGQQAPNITFPGDMPTQPVGEQTLRIIGSDAQTDDETRRLVRYWAIAFTFERAYRLIFGTQIVLLQRANIAPAPIAYAQEQHQASVVLGNKQTFEQYIGFLIGQGLLKPNENETFSITLPGKQFLLYLTREGYPVKKVL